MRTVQITAYGAADALHLVEMPTPEPEPGTVRIRIRAAAVNPADWKWRAGVLHDLVPLTFPHVLGYDVAGAIDAVGEGVNGLATGDRVVAMLPTLTKGGYAEQVVVAADLVARIPDGLGFAAAAAIPTAGLTGVQLIEEYCRPAPGETVLLTGALGAVGRFALHAALAQGARVVAAVRPGQVEAVLALGVAEAIMLDEPARLDRPVDYVADTVGGAKVAALCRSAVPRGGIWTVATDPIDPDGLIHAPVFVAVHADARRLGELAALVAAGALEVPVARRLPLEHAAEAQRLVEAGGTGGRIILEP